jgi:hypothetical protein
MGTELVKREAMPLAQSIEQVLIGGDLSKLDVGQRLSYYRAVCNSVGLNPLTKPFDYLSLNGKLVLYAKRDATDQLRKIHGVSITSLESKTVQDVYVVTAQARDKDGRTDSATGAVNLSSLKGDALANALMKAETKAKRRVTLSICGLGLLDETEIETIQDAKPVGPSLPSSRQQDRQEEDVVCAQCGLHSGHAADCPTQQKQQAQSEQAAGPQRRFVNVESVAKKKSKKNTPYAEVRGVTRDGEKLTLYAYEKEIVARAEEWKGLWCDFALEYRPSTDGKKTFITLLSVFNVNGTKYVDNKPVPASEEGQYIDDQDEPTNGQPDAAEMGF